MCEGSSYNLRLNLWAERRGSRHSVSKVGKHSAPPLTYCHYISISNMSIRLVFRKHFLPPLLLLLQLICSSHPLWGSKWGQRYEDRHHSSPSLVHEWDLNLVRVNWKKKELHLNLNVKGGRRERDRERFFFISCLFSLLFSQSVVVVCGLSTHFIRRWKKKRRRRRNQKKKPPPPTVLRVHDKLNVDIEIGSAESHQHHHRNHLHSSIRPAPFRLSTSTFHDSQTLVASLFHSMKQTHTHTSSMATTIISTPSIRSSPFCHYPPTLRHP